MQSIFFLAIAAGFLTILAPCILPLLPFLLGTSGGRSKYRPLMIISGFVGSFSLIGAAIRTFGTFFGASDAALRNVAVVLLLLFGLALLFEDFYDKLMVRATAALATWGAKISHGAATKTDALSGLLVGVSLGLIWTPCAGPILGAIFTLASRNPDFLTTFLLLFAYSFGAGVPMLAITYGGSALQKRLLAVGKWQRAMNKVFGLLIIIMAVLIFLGYDTELSLKLIDLYPKSFTDKL